LAVGEIWLALFVEAVDETNRQKGEAIYRDDLLGVTVYPVLLETGG
jgi:hypothetical protein